MTQKLSIRRYEAYKNSGIEWLGEVPETWGIFHLKRLSQKITDGAHTSPDLSSSDYPFLTVVNLNDGKLDFKNCLFTSGLDYKQLLRNGCQPKKYDVLYSKDGTISETVVIDEDRNFVVGSSFIIVRPQPKTSNSNYLCYLLSSAIMRYQARIYVKGASLPRISIFNIAKLVAISPPLFEQRAIAAYLDTQTAQLDRKIELLGQKATQYGKLKQSLINETVTRGLDKNVGMKDSGVEWIGEMPAHWDIRRLKELSDIQNSIVDKKSHEHETPIQLCNYVDVYKNEFIDASLDFMWATADKSEIKRFAIKKNDVFITKDSETCDDIAIPALATESLDGVLCGYHLARFRTNDKVLLGTYLFRLFQSKSYGFRFVISAKGITRVGLGQSAIADSLTPVPPLAEQQAIATYLDSKTAHIDRIVATINSQIDKLKELRKALINDIVTGKIKVA